MTVISRSRRAQVAFDVARVIADGLLRRFVVAPADARNAQLRFGVFDYVCGFA
jgi:hypothetical protein